MQSWCGMLLLESPAAPGSLECHGVGVADIRRRLAVGEFGGLRQVICAIDSCEVDSEWYGGCAVSRGGWGERLSEMFSGRNAKSGALRAPYMVYTRLRGAGPDNGRGWLYWAVNYSTYRNILASHE